MRRLVRKTVLSACGIDGSEPEALAGRRRGWPNHAAQLSGSSVYDVERGRACRRSVLFEGARGMRRLVSILIVLVAVPALGRAQERDPTDMSLEDLMATPVDQVYGASKFLQKVTDAPATVTIVSAEDIKLYGYRTLAEVLRSVEGISTSYDRNYTYLGLRGLSRPGDYNNRLLVLLDGHRTNENVQDQALLGTEFEMDVSLIDRVEVIRGPSAALYGSTAFAAVINVISKKGHQIDGIEASASIASYTTNLDTLAWGKRYGNGLEVLAAGSVLRATGQSHLFFPEFNTAANNGGYADGADGERANKLSLSASWGDFTLHGVYALRTKDVPTASFGSVFNSGREKTVDGRDWIDVQYTKELGQSLEMLARVYWDRYDYEGSYPYSSDDQVIGAPLIINRDHFSGIWWGGEYAVSRRIAHAHRVTAGAEYRSNARQSQLNDNDLPDGSRISLLDSQLSSYTLAFNLQDEFTIGRHLLLNVAGREERLATGTFGFTPKLGLIITPATGTTMKLLFSRALRAPSAYELYYTSPANKGNAALQPERMQSAELNVEHYLGNSMKVSGSLFHNTYRDLIVGFANAEGEVTLANGLQATADGIELSWSVKHRSGIQLRASYSRLFDADQTSQVWTSGAPQDLIKLNIGTSLRPLGATIGWETQYESERHTHVGDTLGAVVVANVNVVRSDVLKGLDFRASLFNLFGARYSEPVSENHLQGSILQDGRQVLIGLAWRMH
jgi:outer membrane receptor for ferrienterochelin and colicins